ncbi:hypothetical protein ACJJTC_018429 [Scirpophaga incertulas]
MSLIKLNFRHLLCDELKYELKIRGHENVRTVAEMRSRISTLIKTSQLKVKGDFTELDIDYELETCENKLNDISSVVSSGEFTPSQKERFLSRILHIQLRLSRLTPDNEETAEKVSLFMKECQTLLKLLNVSTSGDVKIQYADDQPSQTSRPPAVTTETRDFAMNTGELRITLDPSRSVSKWNVRYSGHNSRLNLHAFLDRIDTFRTSKDINEQELLRGISDLLEGEALQWYQSYGKSYSTWIEFVNATDREDYVGSLVELKDIFLKVKQKLNSAYERGKKIYNRRKRDVGLKVGQVVWKKDYILSKASENFARKLAPRNIKCVVEERVSPLVYRLRALNGRKLGLTHIKDIIHVE